MAFPSFKKRDNAIQEELRRELAMMEYKEDESDVQSELSEYGKDILKQLELDENKTYGHEELGLELGNRDIHSRI